MAKSNVVNAVLKELKENDGILAMKPAWVYRTFLPSGRRLGLKAKDYTDPVRGEICERWLVSETQADNEKFVKGEGQSYINFKTSKENVLLPEALEACSVELMGAEYAKKHKGLDRLLKIYDYKTRLFYHIHQRDKDAKKVGRNSKEEAYYFLDAPLGNHPETFFGVHPYIVKNKLVEKLFLPYLKNWKGEEILQHAFAFTNVPGEGFHLPAGLLHAPGTALTLELQESSDVMAILQAEIEGIKMSKKLLFKDIAKEDVKKKGEAAVFDQIDWKACADPYFYENHHLAPRPVAGKVSRGAVEEWVWYNSGRFSGTRITLQKGASYTSNALGVHGLFVWKGEGFVDKFSVAGQKVSLSGANDEFLITHDKALKGVAIKNTGSEPMVVFKFFGPDINNSIAPMLPQYKG
ncbi:hypothetical protein FACS189468_6180 [Spirochaetia bacterium]|nr:hypothetical protein FACS189468_6180 [Spirochaetia bacterium]